MKRFILEAILFFATVLLLYLAIAILSKPRVSQTNDYMAALIDKHRRAEEVDRPKIIFAGGSNLAFGLDSRRVEEELGRPVVNLGLHAGLGMDFIISELESVVDSGDMVIISPEYFLRGDGQYNLKKFTAQLYPKAAGFYRFNLREEISLNLRDTRKNAKNFSFKKPAEKRSDRVYSREGFNDYGDLVSYLSMKGPGAANDRVSLSYRYWEGIAMLNRMVKSKEARDVHFCLVYPVFPETMYANNRDAISRLAEDLESGLNMEILCSPEDMVFPDSLFFDKAYHLDSLGRELRTAILISKMSACIAADE